MGYTLQVFPIYALVIALGNAAAFHTHTFNTIPRINNGEKLVSSIASDCFNREALACINEKVLMFLNTFESVRTEEYRSFKKENIEEEIFQQIGRVLSANQIRIELPETFFQGSVLTYQPSIGFDLEVPHHQGRGILLKKKLLLPLLLLLKLKIKALMPILVALIGIKAIKALILSKIAIKLVLGFLIYQLFQKLSGMKMSMMPMMPIPSSESPMSAYGVPPATTPPSSYEPSWEPSGGPYARVWNSSPQNLAYNAYYSNNSGDSVPTPSEPGSN